MLPFLCILVLFLIREDKVGYRGTLTSWKIWQCIWYRSFKKSRNKEESKWLQMMSDLREMNAQ